MSQAGQFSPGGGGGGSGVQTLTPDSGGAVSPTANNINTLGTANQITTIGHPLTSTINFAFTPSIVVANNVTLTAGNLNLASTTSSSQGTINIGGLPFLNDFPGASNNTWVGTQAGNYTLTGANNTGIGFQALTFATTPGNNTAVGSSSMGAQAVSAANNTGLGYLSLNNLSTGANNTAIGSNSMAVGTVTEANNTAVGFTALNNLTSGVGNTAVGSTSMANNAVTGSNNTAIGFEALADYESGNFNTALGAGSLQNLTTGSSNCGHGQGTLANLITGSNNITLGTSSGGNYTGAESNNILVGFGVTGTTGESNALRIGLSSGTGAGQLSTAFIQGISGVTVTGSAVLCATNGQLGTVASSARFKDNIVDMEDSNLIYKLRPVNFTFKSDASNHRQWGLIAEEVESICPELVIRHHKTGELESVRYLDLIPMLLKEVQELRKAIYKIV